MHGVYIYLYKYMFESSPNKDGRSFTHVHVESSLVKMLLYDDKYARSYKKPVIFSYLLQLPCGLTHL